MTVYFETYRGLTLEIFYTEEGYCYAACQHPFKLQIIESEWCDTPRQAFDRLKKKIDFLYEDRE